MHMLWNLPIITGKGFMTPDDGEEFAEEQLQYTLETCGAVAKAMRGNNELPRTRCCLSTPRFFKARPDYSTRVIRELISTIFGIFVWPPDAESTKTLYTMSRDQATDLFGHDLFGQVDAVDCFQKNNGDYLFAPAMLARLLQVSGQIQARLLLSCTSNSDDDCVHVCCIMWDLASSLIKSYYD